MTVLLVLAIVALCCACFVTGFIVAEISRSRDFDRYVLQRGARLMSESNPDLSKRHG